MSVSDPLLKELKGHTLMLTKAASPINDENSNLEAFCQCLEKIFQKGLITQHNALGFYKSPESWDWLRKVGCKRGPYSYQSSVSFVNECTKVTSSRGRLRLLIRMCLNQRCIHVPIQLLNELEESLKYYQSRQSIIGDEVLREIFLSVLRLCSRLQFKLNVSNARFLDETWILPVYRKLQLVPCKELGVSVLFINSRAVVVDVQEESVASEDDNICVGDIIDELNDFCIDSSQVGNLQNIMRHHTNQPISICLIKPVLNNAIYPPMMSLLCQANLDPVSIQYGKSSVSNLSRTPSRNRAGHCVRYIGNISTGDNGDVKRIHSAIDSTLNRCGELVGVSCWFDCLELEVQVTCQETNEVLLKHSYTEISSCGRTVNRPNYFAYIAGNTLLSLSKQFTCYVFSMNDVSEIDTILQNIGQGFRRTNFAV
ncbi:unnamed protein product [Bemisia tabaci]|uniref:RUN domain-containing protein n=1 Tax=Bemisia tabaci TaxID=7038 RepID=A0A9P0AC78_BEMTA|nr:unnamed protein product [Bemisia tabaci]